jgi:hypothetical protein
MGLSTEEAERAVDALVGIQEDLAKVSREEIDPARGREIYHRALVDALGPERASKYESLTESLPARAELRTLRNYLEDVGTPLSDEQQSKLLAVLAKTQGQTGSPAAPPDPSPAVQLMAQAHDVLSKEQTKYLGDFLPLIEHSLRP